MAKIIENTIRDGSYTVNFQLSLAQSNAIVKGLDELGFEYIEIGHGLGLGAGKNSATGLAKESDEVYIKGAKSVAKNSKIGVFFIPGIGSLDDISHAADLGADFIRIGVNINSYQDMFAAAKLVKERGLWLGLNLMKSYAVKSYEFMKIVKDIDSWGLADAIYLVDSAGCMTPEEVFSYIDLTRDHIKTPLGFHGHNNLSLAVANSLSAVKAGAEFVDSSILGMGRSAGNAQTEVLTYLLNKEGLLSKAFDQYKLYDFADNVIAPLMTSKQGLDSDAVNIGVSKFHTSYLPLINECAEKYDVDVRKLIKEVSDVNCLNPERELVMQIAISLVKPNGKQNNE
jgi:4-hydroxy-2-oxovalerate aldolase